MSIRPAYDTGGFAGTDRPIGDRRHRQRATIALMTRVDRTPSRTNPAIRRARPPAFAVSDQLQDRRMDRPDHDTDRCHRLLESAREAIHYVTVVLDTNVASRRADGHGTLRANHRHAC